MRRCLRTLAACAPYALALLNASAVDVTWDNRTAYWFESDHWGLALGYPDNNLNPPTTYAVTIAGGQITLGDNRLIDALTFTDGTLRGATLSIVHSLTLNTASANMLLDGTTLLLLPSATGTLASTSRPLTLNDGSINNQGQLTATAGGIQGGSFVNAGTFTVDCPAGTFTIGNTQTTFTNNGAILVKAGTLALRNIPQLDPDAGAITVNAGAALEVHYFSLHAGSILTGDGDVTFANTAGTDSAFLQGAYDITGATTVNSKLSLSHDASTGTLNIHGNIYGTASLTASALTTWTSGEINARGGLFANGGLAIANGYVNNLYTQFDHPLYASITLPEAQSGTFGDTSIPFNNKPSQTTLTLFAGASFTNRGTLLAHGGVVSLQTAFVTPATFNNVGTLTIDAPASAFSIIDSLNGQCLRFVNTGTVHLKAGTFNLRAGDAGATAGNFHLDAGTLLTLSAQLTFTADSSLDGAGNLSLAYTPRADFLKPFAIFNGNINLTGDLSVDAMPLTINGNAAVNNFSLSNTSLSGAGQLTVNQFTWTSCSINIANLTITKSLVLAANAATAPLPAQLNGGLTIGAAASLSFQAGDNFLFGSGGSLTNNGLITALHNLFVTTGTLTKNPLFTNNGTLYFSTASSVSSKIHFINNGILHITSDPTSRTLKLANTGLFSLDSGSLNLDAQDPASTGEFHIAADAALTLLADFDLSAPDGPTLTGDGLVVINPGVTLTLPIDSQFSGTLQINGTLFLTAPANPANVSAAPAFTILPAPEPASLVLLTLALPLLHRRAPYSRKYRRTRSSSRNCITA